MTWLLIIALCLVAGGLRFLDGSSIQYPRFASTALLALVTALTAWLASSNLIASALAAVNGAVCIHLGQTKWESWKWQTIRSGCFGLLLITLHTYLVAPLPWQSALGIAFLYVIAYVNYSVGYHKMTGEWERFSRVIQGAAICGAAGLV